MAVDDVGPKPSATVTLPQGVTAREARFLLEVFSRVKAKRFGRLAVVVSDGRVVDVEIVEKIDRSLVKVFST
ncbi:MAG: hypothetical protein HYY95_18310 [Candidatus Rokubacteria bacterium]|nr:hypothetical protein [Candidatus Rokubacteria bacterium]